MIAPSIPPILVVDDDLDIREALADLLADEGFPVATAKNGLDALNVLGAAPVRPSVILLDLMMPVMDGYRFLEEQRQRPDLASIPVAIITAGSHVDRARLDGRPILKKPIEVPELVRTLRELRSRSSGGAS